MRRDSCGIEIARARNALTFGEKDGAVFEGGLCHGHIVTIPMRLYTTTL